ncbi:FtsW/RodA/SpoVE family cell cycle protein [Anoxybacterium hadale]|uniref:FtsW/RodA/SpoVE family cell cycle protein n=1 Tax=Anoxybacterium hadale TaxID=3408580 RepID=A0ACD1AGN1_9FIRM|nr:FtsW/RodA/SpoVE family cell cycle protein [Clostridiales bacterium]
MHKKISLFLNEVCQHIKCKAVHKEIREELSEHICDLMEENIEKGISEEKALDLAISAMGNTGEIGAKLHRQHKPQTEWSLLILVALITVIGGIVLYSSSQFSDDNTKFLRHVVSILIGIGVMSVFYFYDYTKLERMSMPLYCSASILILFTMVAGIQMNGAKRWLPIGGGFTISVPELASLLFVISFAGFLERYRGKGTSGSLKMILLGACSLMLLVIMPSIAAAFIVAITYAVLLIAAVAENHFSGNRKNQFILLSSTGTVSVGLLLYYILSNSNRVERFLGWLPGGTEVDYQQNLAGIWLSLSKWFGKTNATYQGHGLGMMPDVTGEYILINVIATLGWAAGLILIALIGIFIVRMLLTIKKVKRGYGFCLALSACTMLSAQFACNILMNFRILPSMGIPMPLVSYGYTGYIVCMVYIGIILSVWRRNNLISFQMNRQAKFSQNSVFRMEDGRLIIDFKAWRHH